jgi:hypothetical protein
MAMCAVGVMASSVAAGAAGILPPNNPAANIAPSSTDFLSAIDSARAVEGVTPMAVTASQLSALSIPEQLFVIMNLERIDRGLPPIEYMTSQLNALAQGGADSANDPGFPSTLTGGLPVTYAGSVWAGGLSSPLEADYYWMYDDGWGGSAATTSNAACSLSTYSSCWAHRDIILHADPSCGGAPSVTSMGAAYSPIGYGGGSLAGLFANSCGTPADVVLSWSQLSTTVIDPTRVVSIATLANGTGYWEAEANGVVGSFGAAQNYGSMAGTALNSPIVGMAATPDGQGYWLVAADGGIFTFGDATFHGSAGSLRLNSPIVGMTSTADGQGYWMVAADGGIFSYGDASFHGSMGGRHLNRPIVGMAADPDSNGYWLVASDGGIFSFGAPFWGSTGSLHLVQPIVGMEALTNGMGYRFEAADGGVFCFGQAPFLGSIGGHVLSAPVVSMAPDSATDGYWLAASDGGIFGFGGAGYFGRLTS